MDPVIEKSTVHFLTELKKNNNREWFEANRREYESARDNMLAFTEAVIREVLKFDKSVRGVTPKESVFRIFRDTRFSKEKSPYKTNLGAFVKSGGKRSPGAGYYIHIEPGSHFLGGGIYQPEAADLLRIRTSILEKSVPYRKIIHNPEFEKEFGAVGMDPLKTAPKGFDKSHPDIDLIRFKSYVAGCKIKDATLSSSIFFEETVRIFRLLHPFNSFLNAAVGVG